MRSIYKIVVCSLLTLSITSCEKDLLEKEQYQKEIYLIGAYNRVWTTEVSYSNEEVKTYFTQFRYISIRPRCERKNEDQRRVGRYLQ